MDLKTWAQMNGMNLDAVAAGVGGILPRTMYRVARGEVNADADTVERIAAFTNGQVGVADMHAVRLRWLASNSDAALGAAAQVQP